MLSWTTLRTISLVLLCLPLIHVAYLGAEGAARYLDPSPEVWRAAMDDIIEADMGSVLPEAPILVVGGQRVSLWSNLSARLEPRTTLLRPLGDATLEDISHYYDRLIAYYRASTLVVFPGYSELHLRDNKTPAVFQSAARALLEKDRLFSPQRRRILLTPLMTPLHPGDRQRIVEITRLCRELTREFPQLTVLDPNEWLVREDGLPDPAFFRIDGINLNDEGYARLAIMLGEALPTTS
ncbi:MAG: hypothetical protein AAFY29_10705 [Pseudomonadota bacterium]